MTDVSANDGKVWGYHGSPRRRSHMASEMAHVRERMQRGEIPQAEGVTPIVVTFHDTNDYTAEHMQEYLQILVDESAKAGLTLAAQPFYDDGAALEQAALVRARDVAHRVSFMDDGVIAEEGSADAVLGRPANPRTRAFLSRFRLARGAA